jgi:hypothetical protein
MSTRGQFNTKNPTIKRICIQLSMVMGDTELMCRSKGSLGTLCITLRRLPCRASRNQSLRVALHHPRPARAIAVRRWHLPRSHSPSIHVSSPPTILPLPHAHWPLRSQSRNLPKHIGPSRRDMAAGMGRAHSPGRDTELHGHRCEGAAGRHRVRQRCT